MILQRAGNGPWGHGSAHMGLCHDSHYAKGNLSPPSGGGALAGPAALSPSSSHTQHPWAFAAAARSARRPWRWVRLVGRTREQLLCNHFELRRTAAASSPPSTESPDGGSHPQGQWLRDTTGSAGGRTSAGRPCTWAAAVAVRCPELSSVAGSALQGPGRSQSSASARHTD